MRGGGAHVIKSVVESFLVKPLLDGFKKWAPTAGAVWILTAFVAWHFESKCGVFFSPKCLPFYWDGLRWIVLLKWVYPYQTLLGAVGAVGAGAFVLVAAQRSSKDLREAEDANRKRVAVVACSMVGSEFLDVQVNVLAATNSMHMSRSVQNTFVQTPGHMPAIHAIDSMLGSIVAAQKRDIEKFIADPSKLHSRDASREIVAKCLVIWHLLIWIGDNLDSDGTYGLRRSKPIPAGQLSSLMKNMRFEPRQLIGLYSLFDWSE